MDPEAVEKVEAELDSFIERRAREAKDAAKVEELWVKSELEHRERRRWENGWAWVRHYQGIASVHHGLALENEGKAARVLAVLEDAGEVA